MISGSCLRTGGINLLGSKNFVSETEDNAGSKRIVIYACSGCSDAGELADRTARVLSQMELGEMSCLAGIGGRVKPLMAKAEQADHIVAIDGCPLNCARLALPRFGGQELCECVS